MSELSLSTNGHESGWDVMAIGGEIDLATVDQLQNELKSILSSGDAGLAVDLTSTDFMDSTGLKCLVESSRSFSEVGRDFALVVAGGPISRLIDLSGIGSKVRVVDSLDQLTSEGV